MPGRRQELGQAVLFVCSSSPSIRHRDSDSGMVPPLRNTYGSEEGESVKNCEGFQFLS